MVMRNIVKIDEEKCDGCAQCVTACAEGAIEIIDGKAKLVSEIYCDGLGACIGHCPRDAITIEQRQADDFDEEATKEHLAAKAGVQKKTAPQKTSDFVCPGMKAQKLREKSEPTDSEDVEISSQLSHWPVKLKLVSPQPPYFTDADLILTADCVPFAMADFHSRFLKNRSVVIGCPKFDEVDFYIEKLSQILKLNNLNSLTVIHMEVPCCSGLTSIARQAIIQSGSKMSFEDVTVSLRGKTIKSETIKQ